MSSRTDRRRRVAAVVLGLVASVAALGLVSVAVGSAALSPGQVWHALRGTGAPSAVATVRELRLPRTVLGLVVGAALGAAGALAQGHTRNPLADPGLLGIGAGAAFAVVCAITFAGVRTAAGYVWFGLLGAAVATLAVGLVAGRGGSGVVPLALAGAAVTALLSTGTSLLVLDDRTTLDVYRRWVAGSLSGRDLGVVLDVAPFVVVGLVLAVLNAPGVDALALGGDVAVSLGHRVGWIRVTGLAAVVLLTGSAVAAAGPIGFLGLAAPHLARRLVGPGARALVPVSALVGIAVLLAADVAGRVLVRPAELQVGIVLALAGGPLFVAVARRRQAVSL